MTYCVIRQNVIYWQCFELQITDAMEKMELLIEYLVIALYLHINFDSKKGIDGKKLS